MHFKYLFIIYLEDRLISEKDEKKKKKGSVLILFSLIVNSWAVVPNMHSFLNSGDALHQIDFSSGYSAEFVVPWVWLWWSRCLFKELIKIFILIPCSFRENSEKLEFSSPYWNSSKFGWLNKWMNVACLAHHAFVQFFSSWVIM